MGRRVWNIIQDTFPPLPLGQAVGLWDYGTQSMKHNAIYFSFLYPWFKLWDSDTLGRREWNIILDTVPPLPLGQTVGLWDFGAQEWYIILDYFPPLPSGQTLGLWDYRTWRMKHNTRYFSSFTLTSSFGMTHNRQFFLSFTLVVAVGLWDYGTQRLNHNVRDAFFYTPVLWVISCFLHFPFDTFPLWG